MTELSCRRLYVNGVDKNMKNGELVAHFKKFGPVIDVYNSLRGFAFVSFQNKYSAAMARREMDQTTMDGRIITVKFARTKRSSDSVRNPGGLVGYGSLDRGGQSESESRGGSGDSVGCEVIEENRSRTDDRITEMFESVYHLGGLHGEEENTENIEETVEVKVTKKRVKHRKRFNPKLETIEEEGSMEENNDQSMALSNLQWFQWLQSKGSDLGVRDVEVDTEVSSSSSRHENEMVGNKVNFDVVPEFEVKGETIGWLPPDIPSVKDFRCVCSYVDYNGILSVSTKEQVETRLLINTWLENYYFGSEPSSTDKDWVSGERCIARFMLDGKWYRATVVTTDISRVWVLVLFVDYGNMEWCKEEDLRRDVRWMEELPIQSLTVQVEIPGNSLEWTLDLLNLLHLKMVDKELVVRRLDKVFASLPMAGRVEYLFDIGQMVKSGKFKEFDSVVNNVTMW